MSEDVIFQCIKYRRYPDSKNLSERVYFTSDGLKRSHGRKRLHQEIWISIHGEIPQGYAIHHKDGNSLNNEISNLECISRSLHMSQHAKENFKNPERRKKNKEHLNKIRKLSHGWRRTPEGKAWHTEHAFKSIVLKVPKKFNCIECGKASQTTSMSGGKYCSARCNHRVQARVWRKRHGIQPRGG